MCCHRAGTGTGWWCMVLMQLWSDDVSELVMLELVCHQHELMLVLTQSKGQPESSLKLVYIMLL